MEEIIKPEQNAPITGAEEAGKPATPAQQPVAELSKETQDALDLASATLSELENAQKKIIHLERDRQDGDTDPELREEVAALKEEIVALREQQAKRMTEDSSNIAKLRTREAELRAALIARQTSGNSSLGANQDKSKLESPLPALNPQQEKLYSRIAARKGMTLEEWRKKNNK